MNDARLTNWLAEQELRLAWLRRNSEIVKQKAPCDCVECRVNGKPRASMPIQHDCEYVIARMRLIPIAEANATAKVGASNGENGERWTQEFVRQMETLSAPLLRQSSNGAHDNSALDGTRESQAAQESQIAYFMAVGSPAEQIAV